MTFLKVIFIFLGTLSLCLGLIGIFIPGLPTTPFLLLTAALYIKSSDKFYQKVIENRIVGAYVIKYRTNNGMTKRDKLYAISLMWVMIAISCIFFIDSYLVKTVVALVGVIGTIVMGFVVPLSK